MKKLLLIIPSFLLFVACNDYKTIENIAPQKNSINLGEKFKIILPENHTSGYMWQLAKDLSIDKIDYLNSVWHGNEKGVYFHFQSIEKGTAKIRFDLIKYKDTLETKYFIINVK